MKTTAWRLNQQWSSMQASCKDTRYKFIPVSKIFNLLKSQSQVDNLGFKGWKYSCKTVPQLPGKLWVSSDFLLQVSVDNKDSSTWTCIGTVSIRTVSTKCKWLYNLIVSKMLGSLDNVSWLVHERERERERETEKERERQWHKNIRNTHSYGHKTPAWSRKCSAFPLPCSSYSRTVKVINTSILDNLNTGTFLEFTTLVKHVTWTNIKQV